MSDVDSYLMSQLAQEVGDFTNAIPSQDLVTPSQQQILANLPSWAGQMTTPAGQQYAQEVANIQLLSQGNKAGPFQGLAPADAAQVASGWSGYDQLDATGQQILQMMASVQNMWQNYKTATASPNTWSYNAPSPSQLTTPTPPPASSQAYDKNAFATLTQLLNQYGLGSLATFVQNELINGIPQDQVALDITNTPEFNARFPAIQQRRSLGLPAISPTDYLNLEDQYTQILQQYGMPQGFYDQHSDFTNLIANDVSPAEFQQRIQQGYSAVQTAPPEVRAAFSQMFGPSGDAALAAYVMDPTRSTPLLLQQVQAANIAGIGTDYGFGLSTDQAMKLSQLGVTNDQAKQQFQTGENMQSLIHGSISDQRPLGQEGVVAGLFGTTPMAAYALNQAVQAKQADFSGGGQAATESTGVTGLGAARSI